MCKLHGYHYACGHFIRYPLSRCRGTFTKARKRGGLKSLKGEEARIAACIGECYIVITSRSPCGSCLYEQYRHYWNARISEAERAYRDALDRGLKCGVGLWGWGGRGWDSALCGDESMGETGEENSMGEDSMEKDTMSTGKNDGNTDKKWKTGLREEIEHRSQTLDDLRDQYNAESWAIRKLFPPFGRSIPSAPTMNSRPELGPSPLRCEVLPEEVVIRARQSGWDDHDGEQCHSTFQAYFVDRYSDVPIDAWNCSDNSGGEAWDAGH